MTFQRPTLKFLQTAHAEGEFTGDDDKADAALITIPRLIFFIKKTKYIFHFNGKNQKTMANFISHTKERNINE